MWKESRSLLEEPEENEDWLKTCHNTEELLMLAARRLVFIADRLAYVMPQCDALNDMVALAGDFQVQAKRQSQATTHKVVGDMKDAEAMSGSMLKACLVGVFMHPATTAEEKADLRPLIDGMEKE